MSSPTQDQERATERRGRTTPADGDGRGREEKKRRGWRDHPFLVGAGALVFIALVTGGVLYWLHSRSYESTDDAFIDVVSERVSARVPGRVLRVLVNDNQDVNAGDVLVKLDPAEFVAAREQAAAALARAKAGLAQAQAEQRVREAELEQARAAERAAEASRKQAASDVERTRRLRDAGIGAVAQQQVDSAEAAATSTAAQVESASRAVAAAEAQIGLATSQIEAARAGVKSAEAQLRQADLNLSYTDVKARTSGRVASRSVAEGNYVEPGLELMAIVPRQVYVTANFKETQLQRIRPGQHAEVEVDAYPDLELGGRVESIQPAAGQAFSVLPAQNATGNWVKVVQRVPVKIVLDRLPGDPRRLGPGMSVGVRVSVK